MPEFSNVQTTSEWNRLSDEEYSAASLLERKSTAEGAQGILFFHLHASFNSKKDMKNVLKRLSRELTVNLMKNTKSETVIQVVLN